MCFLTKITKNHAGFRAGFLPTLPKILDALSNCRGLKGDFSRLDLEHFASAYHFQGPAEKSLRLTLVSRAGIPDYFVPVPVVGVIPVGCVSPLSMNRNAKHVSLSNVAGIGVSVVSRRWRNRRVGHWYFADVQSSYAASPGHVLGAKRLIT